MNSRLQKKLLALESPASTVEKYKLHLESIMPAIDLAISKACGGDHLLKLNPASLNFIKLGSLRLTEYMSVLSGCRWQSYQDFQDSKNSPISKELYV